MNLVRLWESRDLNMYMYRCVQLYLVPIPHDPNSVYMCLCLLSSKALGIEESEYVYIYMCRVNIFGCQFLMMRSECFGRSSKNNSEANVSRHTFASPGPMHFNAKLRSTCMLIPAPLTPCTAHPISGPDAPALNEDSPLLATAGVQLEA